LGRRAPLVQSTSQTPDGPLELDVYPGEDCQGVLYADDGHSMAYIKGGYARQTVRCSMTANGVTVTFDKREGAYQPWWKAVRIVVHGWQGGGAAKMAGLALDARVDADAGTIDATISASPLAQTATFTRD
jgi:alpha-glucosidase